MNRSYEALQELQEKAAEKDDVSKALKDAKEYTDQKAQAVTPESIGAETPTGAQEKADAALTVAKQYTDENINVLRADVDSNTDEIRNLKQSVDHVLGKPLGIKPGLQVVEVENDTPFQMGEIKGRTLINLLGRVGDCENTADWSAPGPGVKALSTERVYGSFSIEVASTKEEQAGFGIRSNGAVKDLDKYYIAVGYIRNISAQYVHLSFAEVKSEANVTSWFKSNGTVKSNQFTYAYVAVSPVDLAGKDRVEVYVRGVASEAGQKISADGIGLYEITEAEYNAIEGMTPEQVAKRYPYVDSMTNVKNPYAIVTGGNLLPPFYEADRITVASKATVVAPYELRFGAGGDGDFLAYHLSVLPNQTYVFSLENSGVSWCITELDYNTFVVPYGTDTYRSFNVGSRTQIALVLKSFSADIDVSCKNPMLTVGTEAKPFVPQQRSMIAFETELAAHPVDGSNPDTLFMGDDGLPYVLEPWGKVTLDGSHVWKRHSTQNDFKVLSANDCVPNNSSPADEDDYGRLFVTKYNGSLLSVNDKPINVENWGFSDVTRIFTSNAYISVHNNESGWGGNYNPEPDEIKAYFNGWRMYQEGSRETPYTSGKKQWFKINKPSDPSVADTPTTSYPEWTPYRLQYLKAKPTVEPVRNYELGATLSAGSNMVEVGSGIVIRERANPAPGVSDEGNINNAYLPATMLRHRTHVASAIVYKNNAIDRAWIAKGDNVLQTEPSYYDPTAIYHVTYTMLHPTLAPPISGTVAANLRGTVSDLVKDVGDIGRRLSVVETQKAEKDAPPPLRIKPTLLNGWVDYGSPFEHSFYYKDDSNVVSIEGLIGRGTAALGTSLFILPTGFRPDKSLIFPVLGWVTGVGEALVRIDVDPTGIVKIGSPNAKNDYLSLQGISFLANK
ncbi:hypothetical protein WJ0W_007033 [Paenibacillus melissococcoides]|uniref:Tail fiber protein n=6 Tax=Paenibacillus TaxID=44249 RepID=A0ABM9GDJ6_9BACL|nr:hypothetical protein WJ0W_006034 [Paenibacillus melissococcoides]CAH8249360.1 hypothetical protein WJ0W_006546 [Paenibacillus melissococcoides]CAH8249849.1 hypothetical protein WJ0W_007033 [Paenibacillus melissococcoides]